MVSTSSTPEPFGAGAAAAPNASAAFAERGLSAGGMVPRKGNAPPGGDHIVGDMRLEGDRRIIRYGVLAMAASFAMFIGQDFALFAVGALRFELRVAIRVALLAVAGWTLGTIRQPAPRAVVERAAFVWAMAAAVGTIAIVALRRSGDTMPLRGPLLNLMAMYAALPNTTRRQLTPPLTLAGALVVLRLTRVNGGGAIDIANDLLVLVVASALGTLLVFRRRQLEAEADAHLSVESELRRSLEATLGELRTIRGMLPICAHCHRIRSDEGDWQRVEKYVAQHTHAQFSHGICPDCERDHFPRE